MILESFYSEIKQSILNPNNYDYHDNQQLESAALVVESLEAYNPDILNKVRALVKILFHEMDYIFPFVTSFKFDELNRLQTLYFEIQPLVKYE